MRTAIALGVIALALALPGLAGAQEACAVAAAYTTPTPGAVLTRGRIPLEVSATTAGGAAMQRVVFVAEPLATGQQAILDTDETAPYWTGIWNANPRPKFTTGAYRMIVEVWYLCPDGTLTGSQRDGPLVVLNDR